jgi:hypothetical protein
LRSTEFGVRLLTKEEYNDGGSFLFRTTAGESFVVVEIVLLIQHHTKEFVLVQFQSSSYNGWIEAFVERDQTKKSQADSVYRRLKGLVELRQSECKRCREVFVTSAGAHDLWFL